MSGHDRRADIDLTPRRRVLVGLTITAGTLLVYAVGGVLAGSLALLADAGHMLTDAAGLAMALLTAHLTMRPATDRRTWGFRRMEVLAAAAQAALLLVVGVLVLVEAM